MLHVVIAGGSGFVGKELQERLLSSGYKVTILSRTHKSGEHGNVSIVPWLTANSQPESQLSNVDAIVNLAGESINGIRWTKSKKKRILESRMRATRELIRIIKNLDKKPKVLVNASAVGYYGMSETETFTESSETTANDFLASVVKKWEEVASAAEDLGIRTVYARLGIVLGRQGALPLMVLPYKFGIGGTIGTGNQWLSWIHVAEVASLIQYVLENNDINGPLNVTAPTPVHMKEFGQTIGNILHRPHWLPVPSIALKLLLGEMSDMLLSGQCALPEKALQHHYEYQFPKLKEALNEILI